MAVAVGLLPPQERTVPAMVRRQAELFGDAPLVSVGDASWTHHDAAAAAAGRAGALRDAGLMRGDRVAIMSTNRIEFLEVFLGAAWIGLPLVPINCASMAPQIEYYLTNSGARLLVIEAQYLERLALADLSRTQLQTIWVLGGTGNALPDGEMDWVPYPPRADVVDSEEVSPGETLAILYTSGTTGLAKGVACPHAQYFWWCFHTVRVLGIDHHDVLGTTLPLFHINALNTFGQACLAGCRIIIHSRFSASGFWRETQSSQTTVVYLLGAMVPILLAQPATPTEREHKVRIGLGPGVPLAASETFHRRCGVLLAEGYGSTETNFAIAAPPGSRGLGSMGWVQPGFEARVVDENDVRVQTGIAGELVLRTDEPYVFASGYFGMPEKTVEAWRNLWFHTGDRVIQEADGSFRFVDRIKDAIRRRGENISTFEVEMILAGHPSIAEVAVYPVRSDLAEDEVMASIVARASQVVVFSELIAYCEARLPYFAVPRFLDLVADLPRTENGKVTKYKLRERGVTSSTWDRTLPH